MRPLNLPAYPFSLREERGRREIFDEVRRRWVRLTPEEWVRQHVMQFLLRDREVPAALLAVEKSFAYQGMVRRADLVAYDRQVRARLLVECKAADVAISQRTFDQVARYNTVVGASLIVVTNGLVHYAYRVGEQGAFTFLPEIPLFEEM